MAPGPTGEPLFERGRPVTTPGIRWDLRHYQPGDLGGRCVECGHALPSCLAGETRHPCCDPEFSDMAAALKRATLERKRLAKPDTGVQNG